MQAVGPVLLAVSVPGLAVVSAAVVGPEAVAVVVEVAVAVDVADVVVGLLVDDALGSVPRVVEPVSVPWAGGSAELPQAAAPRLAASNEPCQTWRVARERAMPHHNAARPRLPNPHRREDTGTFEPVDLNPADIHGALAGDRRALDALVRKLRPVIQAEVGFALLPLGRSEGRDVRQEALDLVQDVLLGLLRDEGKLLRRWDPERGSSLEGFVRLVARRHVAAVVRSKRRNPYAEHPLPGETLDLQRSAGPELEHHLEARDRVDQMLDHVQQRLDERGRLLFELLYVEERSVDEACAATGMTRDAVYAWRSRLKRQLDELREA